MAQTNSTDGVNNVVKTKRSILRELEREQRKQLNYQRIIDEWCKILEDQLDELNFIHDNPNPPIEFIEKIAPPVPACKKKLRSYKKNSLKMRLSL